MGPNMPRHSGPCTQGSLGKNMKMSWPSLELSMLVFTQYWYWFPLSHFLSLAFTPSCVIGLNDNLDMPVFKIKSNAKPSTYAYPAPLEEKKKEDKEKVATAVLSITAKQKKKEADKSKN